MNEASPINKLEHSETFNSEILSDIASVYGISTLKYISSPEKGIITENAILEDDEGIRYFVKLYRPEKTKDTAGIYRAAELVAENPDIPVSLPISIGGSHTASIDGRSLALFPYIEHRTEFPQNKEEDRVLTSNIARNLGRIHAMPVQTDEDMIKPIKRWQSESVGARVEELQRLKDHIDSLSDLSDFDSQALEVIATKTQLLEQLPDVSGEQQELAICHGDYHGHNVLFNEEMEVVAIIDWDNAGLADPYIDFLQTFMTNVINKKFDTYQTERKENAQTFIKSYVEGAGKEIDTERLKASYGLFMHQRIGAAWPLNQHYFDDNTRNDDRLQNTLDKSIAYAEHYDEILYFILSILQEIETE